MAGFSTAVDTRFLSNLPAPESQSSLKDELKTYLSDADVEKVIAHRGCKDAFILHWQYEAIRDLHDKQLISEFILIVLTGALDELARLQGALKRIKNYPYARNNYSKVRLWAGFLFRWKRWEKIPPIRSKGALTMSQSHLLRGASR